MGRKIPLKHPITAYGEQVTELELPDRLRLRHIRGLDGAKGEVGQLIGLISSMCQIPQSSAEEIDLEDLEVLTDALAPFGEQLSGFLPAGLSSPAGSPSAAGGPPT